MPAAQNGCKKQCEIKIFLSQDQNMTKNMTNAPDANHDKRLTKTAKNGNKKTPFRRVPTAPKCCKKQYEIKIFVLPDQNMTKNVTHAPRANHDKGLTKTAKKWQKKHLCKECPWLKNAVKNHTKSNFRSSMTRKMHSSNERKPHADQDMKVAKKIEKSIRKHCFDTCSQLKNSLHKRYEV